MKKWQNVLGETGKSIALLFHESCKKSRGMFITDSTHVCETSITALQTRMKRIESDETNEYYSEIVNVG